jgi:hypothetical protein
MKRQPHIAFHVKMSVNQAPAIPGKNANDIFLGEAFLYHVAHGVYFRPIATSMHERSYSFSQFLQIDISPLRY